MLPSCTWNLLRSFLSVQPVKICWPRPVPSRLDQMFSDAFSKDHQLIQADPKQSLYLACALMIRGDVQVSDLRRNIERSERPSLLHLYSMSSCDRHSFAKILLFISAAGNSWLAYSVPSLPSPQTLISCQANLELLWKDVFVWPESKKEEKKYRNTVCNKFTLAEHQKV